MKPEPLIVVPDGGPLDVQGPMVLQVLWLMLGRCVVQRWHVVRVEGRGAMRPLRLFGWVLGGVAVSAMYCKQTMRGLSILCTQLPGQSRSYAMGLHNVWRP